MAESVIKNIEAAEEEKRRGRPKGAKDKKPRKPGSGRPLGSKDKNPRVVAPLVDTETGITVPDSSGNRGIIKKIGDERVTIFVQYHMDMMKMRQGVNKKDVQELYQRFYNYLVYCAQHTIMPNNMNAYYAIGVSRQEISIWKLGQGGTPEHKKFAEDITAFFASVHEQAPTEGLMNPISAMFWQKAHDGMIEAQKLEVYNTDPLGEKRSAEDIARSYSNLPD